MSKGRVFQQGHQWWITYPWRQQGCGVEHRERVGLFSAEAYRRWRQRLGELGYGKEGHDAR
jgi:hypothetical protein